MNTMDLFRLDGQIAVVTGAARGLGRQMAVALADAGADIAFCDLLEDESRQTLALIEQRGRRGFFKRVDVTRSDEIEAFVTEVIGRFGGIDILVNNAGRESEGCPIEEVTDDLWRNIIEVNLSGMFYFARAVGRRMIDRKQGGSIINISSISGQIVSKIFPRHNVTYGVSKAGAAYLTRGLASEWATHNIRVNAIAPGYMLTPNNQTSRKFPEIVARIIEMTPLHRYGQDDELNGLVVFLASKASSFMTGSTVTIDGGHTIW